MIKSVQCNWSRCTVVHWAVHKYWLCHTCLLRCPPLGGCSMRYITSVSPMPTVNSKTEHHTMFKLWREVTDMCNNWPINFEGRNRNFFWHISSHLHESISIHFIPTPQPMIPCCTFHIINHQGSGPGRHGSRRVCLAWLSYPLINQKQCDISRRSSMQSLEISGGHGSPSQRSWSSTTRVSYQYSCMVRTAGRYLRRTHARLMHSTSGVCVCCLASNGTNLYEMLMYGG